MRFEIDLGATNLNLNIAYQDNQLFFSDLSTGKTLNIPTISLPIEKIFPYPNITTSYPAFYTASNHQLNIIQWIDLQGHSSFSLLNSIAKIPDIVKQTEYAIALTDYNLFGSFEFNESMLNQGKKPIIGLEIYVDSLPKTQRVKKYTTIQDILNKYRINIHELQHDNPNLKLSNNQQNHLDEVYIRDLNVQDKVFINHPHEMNHLVILALNKRGFDNLSYISSVAQQKITDKKHLIPYVSYQELRHHVSGTIVLTGYNKSEIVRALLKNEVQQAQNVMQELLNIWGPGQVYLEVQRKGLKGENTLNHRIFNLSEQNHVPVVATNDYHMIASTDAEALELWQIDGQTRGTQHLTINDSHWSTEGKNNYILSTSEMEKLWSDHLDVLANSIAVLNRIEPYELETGQHYFPKYKLPQGFNDEKAYFEYLIHKGFKLRFPNNFSSEAESQKYHQRLTREIKTIEDLHYVGYFLIVADFINYAKRNFSLYDKETVQRWQTFINNNNYDITPITIGPGRGSAAGSLVSYVLYITEINPLKGDLLFERFLNPDRHDMPDIDTDMPDDKRAEIIDYVSNYYNNGDNDPFDTHVAGIITFTTLGPRLALKEVSRVLGMSVDFAEQLVEPLPKPPDNSIDNLTFKQIRELFPILQQRYKSEQIVKKIMDISDKLLGCEKNSSQHACGYVITPKPVREYMPIAYVYNKTDKQAVLLTGYTHVEERGLLKMDFLGLKSTRTINDTLQIVNKIHHKTLIMSDILKVAPHDLNVYKYISQGNTEDLFQLSSSGMTDLMKQLYADINNWENNIDNGEKAFERLVAGIALYRPGPMDEIPTYIKNMNAKKVVYPIAGSEKILKPTYGVIVYQEQVMQLVRKIAGFSAGDADVVRKGMGKKKANIIAEYREYFINGSQSYDNKITKSHSSKYRNAQPKHIPGGQELGYSQAELEKLWNEMESFGRYAFNKSHAYSYAYVSITEAWLATYYPIEYLTAVLNTRDKPDEIEKYINIARKRHLKVAPPTINADSQKFTTDGESIQFGLSAVKFVNKSATAIVEEHQEHGDFTSLSDFITRMGQTNVGLKKNTFLSLVYAGVFDKFYKNRQALKNNIAEITQYIKNISQASILQADNISGLLETMLAPKEGCSDFPMLERLNLEKEYTGFYITGNPVTQYLQLWQQIQNQKNSYNNKEQLKTLAQVKKIVLSNKITAQRYHFKSLVVLDEKHEIVRKNKGKDVMLAFQVEDETGKQHGIMFSQQYIPTETAYTLKKGQVYVLEGNLQYNLKDSKLNLVALSFQPVISYLQSSCKDKYYQITLPNNLEKAQRILYQVLQHNQTCAHYADEYMPLVYVYHNKVYNKTRDQGTLTFYNTANNIQFFKKTCGQFNCQEKYLDNQKIKKFLVQSLTI